MRPFFVLFFLLGASFLPSCSFANYSPPLPQAVAPGYTVVRALPSRSFPDRDAPADAVTSSEATVIVLPEESEALVDPITSKASDSDSEVISVPEIEPAVDASAETIEEPLIEPIADVAMPDNRYALAEEALGRGKYSDAVPYLLSLIDEFPENAEFFFRGGFAAFMASVSNQGESWLPQSITLLQRGLELHPQHIEAQFVLGCAYDWSEEWFAAEQAYKRTIELDPSHRKAIQNLAALYQRQGLDSKARELLILLRRL